MEDKMAAGAFGRARNYGRDGPFIEKKVKEMIWMTVEPAV